MNDVLKIWASDNNWAFLWLILLAALKAALLIAFASLLCSIFRRLSAATRHLLLTSALCASLLLPLLSFIHVWEVPILPAGISVADSSAAQAVAREDESLTPSSERSRHSLANSLAATSVTTQRAEALAEAEEAQASLSLSAAAGIKAQSAKPATSLLTVAANWMLLIWLSGVLLLLFRLMIGFTATRSLARRTREFKNESLTRLFSSLLSELKLKTKVRLLRSEKTTMPIVCGLLRPVVLLPAAAEMWSEERQRMVLLHELTHVARHDCLTQMLAQAACAFYWFNPLVWLAARRLRIEREKACDDYVLSVGTKPSDYAHHLLEIARALRERSVFDWSQTISVAMARRSQLEGRLLSILSAGKRRGAVSRTVTTGLVALTGAVLFSLAAVRPTVISARVEQTTHAAASVGKEGVESSPMSSPAANAAQPETLAAATTTIHETGIRETVTVRDDSPVADAMPPDGILPPAPAPVPLLSEESHRERAYRGQDVSGDFIAEMASVGFTNLSIEELIRLKETGVTAEYVRGLRAAGLNNLTPRELASLCANDVTPAYIQEIRAAGYSDLSAKELTAFRANEITPAYIKTLSDAGYGNLPARQVIQFSALEVTPAFIKMIRAAGYNNLAPRELASLRALEITPEFIRAARSRFGELTVKQLIALKNMDIVDNDDNKDKEKDQDED